MINLIVTGILVVIALIIFKSGWLLTFLDNFPFIDNVVSLVTGYLGVTSGTAAGAGTAFFNELLKSIIFLSVFAVVSKVMHSILHIGKHEEASALSRFFAVPLEWIGRTFLSAVVTGLLMEFVNEYLKQALSLSMFWLAGLSTLTVVLSVLLAFIFLGKTLTEFAVMMTFGVIFPAVVKLVAVEFIIIFLYVLLNVPGVFTAAGTMVFTLIGIACCLGCILGAEILGSKF